MNRPLDCKVCSERPSQIYVTLDREQVQSLQLSTNTVPVCFECETSLQDNHE